MMILHTWAVAVLCTLVHGYRDASPFFLLSTAETSLSPPGAHVAQSHQVESYIDDVTRQCLTDTYIIVEEVGVSSADFGDRHAAFGERFADAAGRFQTKVAVANVRGGSVDKSLARSISARCGGEMVSIASMDAWSATLGKSQSVIQIKVPRVMSEIKSTELDELLTTILRDIKTERYTIIYTSTPESIDMYEVPEHEQQVYFMDDAYPYGMHTDMKRDLSGSASENTNGNLDSNLPLFEKYQFVNAAIFMGIAIALLLIMILYVGLSAIAGLEVSYMAFSKEMSMVSAAKKPQ